MTDAGFFKGTNLEQDTRFADKKKKLMKVMVFGEGLSRKVEMHRVNLDVIKPWMCQRITEMLTFEDEVVVDYVINQLEESENPDPKEIQMNLTGFLQARNARTFLSELWDLLISAMENESGIPQKFLDAKKNELQNEAAEESRIQEQLRLKESEIAESLRKMDAEKEEEIDKTGHNSSRSKATSRSNRNGENTSHYRKQRSRSSSQGDLYDKGSRRDVSTARRRRSTPSSNASSVDRSHRYNRRHAESDARDWRRRRPERRWSRERGRKPHYTSRHYHSGDKTKRSHLSSPRTSPTHNKRRRRLSSSPAKISPRRRSSHGSKASSISSGSPAKKSTHNRKTSRENKTDKSIVDRKYRHSKIEDRGRRRRSPVEVEKRRVVKKTSSDKQDKSVKESAEADNLEAVLRRRALDSLKKNKSKCEESASQTSGSGESSSSSSSSDSDDSSSDGSSSSSD